MFIMCMDSAEAQEHNIFNKRLRKDIAIYIDKLYNIISLHKGKPKKEIEDMLYKSDGNANLNVSKIFANYQREYQIHDKISLEQVNGEKLEKATMDFVRKSGGIDKIDEYRYKYTVGVAFFLSAQAFLRSVKELPHKETVNEIKNEKVLPLVQMALFCFKKVNNFERLETNTYELCSALIHINKVIISCYENEESCKIDLALLASEFCKYTAQSIKSYKETHTYIPEKIKLTLEVAERKNTFYTNLADNLIENTFCIIENMSIISFDEEENF